MIGCDAKLAARSQRAGNQLERLRRAESSFLVPSLGPRIGKEQEDARERTGRQGPQQQSRIIEQNADIPLPSCFEQKEQVRDAVDERLATEKADIRMKRSLGRQVLAAAEADFEPELARRRFEDRGGVEQAFGRQADGQCLQSAPDQFRFASPQSTAAPAAIDSSGRRRGQARADFRLATRSVRSQENPPSASGWRPKWPYAAVRA